MSKNKAYFRELKKASAERSAMPQKLATEEIRRRYDRIAPVYDVMESLVELAALGRWRSRLWRLVKGGHVLEVGVGTGKNMAYYPKGAILSAIDLSPRMLKRAADRARRLNIHVDLQLMSTEALAFPDRTFDYVVATLVFCSVADPVNGLRELGRVCCKPKGTILLLEHVRIDSPVVGRFMDFINPLTVRVIGANINRRTVENVRLAGLSITAVEDLGPMGMVKLIVAQPTH